jgi:DNA-binding SARP family transcriptional activator
LSLAPWVLSDAQELRDVATFLIAGSVPAMDAALRLLEFHGELLPEWDDEWLVLDREELWQIHLQALECCAARLLEAGQFPPAMMLAYKAIRADPFRESAHRQLIDIHLAQGNHLQAFRVYRTFAEQLWQDHRVRPSPILQNTMRVATAPNVAAAGHAI